MFFLAQMPATPQLPPLPEGPSLDRVRGPVAISAYEPWQIALAVGFGILVLAFLLWLFLRARRKAAPEIPPYEAAQAELEAAANLTAGDDERFAMLSSQALRRYLEGGLGLRSTARTSEEFLNDLKSNHIQVKVAERGTRFDRTEETDPQLDMSAVARRAKEESASRVRYNTNPDSSQGEGNPKFDQDFQDKLRELLATLDQIKFAQQSISPEARIQITDTVRQLIDQAHATQQEKGVQT